MTSPADHAATVREALEHMNEPCGDEDCTYCNPDLRTIVAALDALQAQAEASERWRKANHKRAEAAEAERDRWLAWSGGDYPDESPGDAIAAEVDGTITLDDSITTWNPKRAAAFFKTERDRLAARVTELEAALREIDSLPNQSEHWHDDDVAVQIARAALDKDTA